MNKYQYKAITPTGEQIQGFETAQNKEELVNRLQKQGYFPLQTRLAKANAFDWLLQKLTFKKHDGLNNKQLFAFTQDLSTLIEAGLSIDYCLNTLSKQESKLNYKDVIDSIHTDIQAGKSLSFALSKHPSSFDEFYIAVIKSGESSGDLKNALKRLDEHLLKTKALRSNIVSAITYPLILLTVSILSFIFILTFVIPRFIKMFEGAEQQLPWLSSLVFSLSEIFRDYWWLTPVIIIIGLIGGRLLIQHYFKQEERLLILLKLPLFGTLISIHQTAAFSRSMTTLLGNGLQLIESVKLAARSVRFPPFRKELEQIAENLKLGKNISYIIKNSPTLPVMAKDLISVGEEAGELTTIFMRLADIYEKETDLSIKRLLLFIEPILIIGLGILVALMILSVLLAMMSLNEFV